MDSKTIREKIECGNFKLRNKRKGKSLLWTIFAEIENEVGVILDGWLCCRTCKKTYKYNGKQSSNLNRHKCFVEKTSDITYKKLTTEEKSEAIDVLTNWVIEDCRPFSAVSGSGFHKMAKYFIKLGAKHGENIDVDDLMPEPTTISRRVNKIAEEHKKKLRESIPELINKNKASMTIDMWTDAYVKRNFLCATFHYEENLILKEIVLGIKSMDLLESSGANISNKLLSMLEEFGVSDISKIKFITDRGSNVKKALQKEIRLNCSNHLLSNVIDAAFESNEEIRQITTACKNLVKFFKKANLQQFLSTTLKNHCPTRWNSFLNLFQSICDNWAEINNILLGKNATYRLNRINFNTLKALQIFCNDIDKISRKLQGSKYPTICYVLPSISRLKLICQPNPTDVQVLLTLKEYISQELQTTWLDNIGIWHKTASFLFPPTNNMHELQLSLVEIKDFCKEQLLKYNEDHVTFASSQISISTCSGSLSVSTPDSLSVSTPDSLSVSTSDSLSVRSIENSFATENFTSSNRMEEIQFFFPNISTEAIPSLSDQIKQEIEQYSAEKIQISLDFNVMTWWGQNERKYPLLSKFALSVLSMPASSAASERVFSLAGNVITEKRNRLAPKTIDNLIFLHSCTVNNI